MYYRRFFAIAIVITLGINTALAFSAGVIYVLFHAHW
jgi:hypothetical protein